MSAPDVLVDTSVAIALMVTDHEHHAKALRILRGCRLGLAGNAAFETFSVPTRLPAPVRRTPASAHLLIEANFPHSRFLSPSAASDLLALLPAAGIAGSSVYDALVGAVANEHGVTLCTRDQRAAQTYRALDVEYDLLGP